MFVESLSLISFLFDLFSSHSNFYRKKNRTGMNRLSQVNDEVQKSEMTSTTAPDYLPYNVYSKLEKFEQKPQEDIHPVNSATNTAQTNQDLLKPRKRHSRPLKLSGDVDLGFKKKRTKGKKADKKNVSPVDDVVPQQSVIDENNNSKHKDDNNNDNGRHHQHKHHNHHHHHPNNALPESSEAKDETKEEVKPIIELKKPVLEFLTSPPEPVEYTTKSTITTTSSTSRPAIIERTTLSELRKKMEEKALRRERLKEKLAKLTPEERQAFLLMKQQRAEAKKKGFKIGSSSSS